jgi:hypothetical protein
MSRTVHVRCTFTIPVEVPDSSDYDAVFDIEENHCPGTGLVGQAIEEHVERCDEQGICWACQLGGTNEIVTNPNDH